MNSILNKDFGYEGMISIDLETSERVALLMETMQKNDVRYFAVNLGYFKTLIRNSGESTNSEVTEETQREMGLSSGLIRFSVGLDHDIEYSWQKIKEA